MFPILVRNARARETIEYGELAREAEIPNPRNLNYVLGCIGQTLLALSEKSKSRIPPIQCLVVNKASRLPSSGISRFLSDKGDFSKLSHDAQITVMAQSRERVFAYHDWSAVLEAIGINDDSDRFSSNDYVTAFQHIGVRPHQRRMLEAQYHATARTVTAAQMAKALGYPSYTAANLHYGRLGRLVGEDLGWRPLPEQAVFVLVAFKKTGREWNWIMRPSVARALEQLGWVEAEHADIPEEVEMTAPLYEGAVRRIAVNAYERNTVAREKCILHYGCRCTACGITVSEKYGEAAQGLIHVHHLRQLADVNAEYRVDPVKDLRPVCPTCHAVIHSRTPPFTVEEVRSMIGATVRYTRQQERRE